MRANRRRTLAGVPSLLVAAMGLCAEPAAASQPPAPSSAETVSRLIAELGPQKAAEQVLNDSPTLEVVAAGVAGGSREWLDVGSQLVGVAESYLKDRLTQSFSIALERDPASVLARGASGVPVQAVCAYDPFTAAETPPTRSQFEGAVAQRERAVSAVRRADLAAAKSRCLEGVGALRSAGTKQYVQPPSGNP